MKTLYCTLIVFLFLFSFPVPFFYNSLFFSLLLSIPLCNSKVIHIMLSFLKTRYVIYGVLLLLASFLYYSLSTILSGVYDFSLMKIYVGMILYGGTGAFVAAVIYINTEKNSLSTIILLCLVIQASIILASFASPAFKSALDIFRTANSVDVAERYYGGGIRGLALSGSQFFGLAVLLASMIYICYVMEHQFSNRAWIYILLLICSIIFLSVGRTVIFGVVFGLLFLLINISSTVGVIFKKVFLIFIISAILISFLPYLAPSLKDKLDSFMYFAFEAIYNYIQYGEVRTSSTDVLAQMYYPLSASTLLHGDGQYLNLDGTYYGHTDAGYMRDVLALGVPFTIILIISFILVMIPSREIFNSQIKKSASIIFIGMMLLLHYKGEVFWTLLCEVGLVFFISAYGHACKKYNFSC